MLVRLKTPVEIQDLETYKRLTIRINHQGVSVRDTEIGEKIGTKSQFRVRAGDFILSKIDARQGAFGIVPPEADDGIITGNFWTYRVDNQLVDTEWFLQFTNSNAFLDLCKRASTGNTHRKYLNEEIFLNHEVAIPSLEEQRKTVAACKAGNKRVQEVQHEIAHQQSLLNKLKQAILQEAIQGKLTADWRAAHPDVEPASQLLHRIQAEKARLIAAKTLRPEKPLPKITAAEIPFEIPEGWEWCRIGNEIKITGGSQPNKGVFIKEPREGYTRFVQIRDFKSDEYKTYIPTKLANRLFGKEDILIGRYGPPVFQILRGLEGTYNVALMKAESRFGTLHNDFLFYLLQEPRIQRIVVRESERTAGQTGVRLPLLNEIPFPLPPLAEQAAIVERVEALMTTCRALEAEIGQARRHADQLLQAVLKEAFAPASGVS
jgi:type I restriction enzyme S subunit